MVRTGERDTGGAAGDRISTSGEGGSGAAGKSSMSSGSPNSMSLQSAGSSTAEAGARDTGWSAGDCISTSDEEGSGAASRSSMSSGSPNSMSLQSAASMRAETGASGDSIVSIRAEATGGADGAPPPIPRPLDADGGAGELTSCGFEAESWNGGEPAAGLGMGPGPTPVRAASPFEAVASVTVGTGVFDTACPTVGAADRDEPGKAGSKPVFIADGTDVRPSEARAKFATPVTGARLEILA